MKYIFILFFLLISFTTFSESKKYALVIAVADYPDTSGWNVISSDNDVRIIKDALLRQGFKSQDITVILNAEATKQNILSRLEELTSKVSKGDIVVLHFSGHGQQIADENGDEPDGYDESIIPFNANKRFSSVYKGENHLRDDELNLALLKLRAKLGGKGNVLVILDSCHSGTATRGYQQSRGTNIKFQPPGYAPKQNVESSGMLDMSVSELSDDASFASLVTFSASSPEQLNYEYTDKQTGITFGSLSYAFTKALATVDDKTTYRGLFDRITIEMSKIAPKQTPQAEGSLDHVVFEGKTLGHTTYFKVTDSIDSDTYVLNAGSLIGVYKGTKLGFYDVNTYDYRKKEPRFTGVVTNVSALTSDVKIINGKTNYNELRPLWAYVTNQTFGNLEIKVGVKDVPDTNLKDLLEKIINSESNVSMSEELPDIIITSDMNSDSLFFYTDDEYLLAKYPIPAINEIQIREFIKTVLEHYFQANFLRTLELSSREYEVSFQIIPVVVKRHGSTYKVEKTIPVKEKYNDANQLVFKVGDTFKLKVKNTGYSKAFFQVLDIQPDNKINILIPAGNNYPSDYIIYPGEEKVLPEIFTIGEPYGKEVFKLIATEKPLDLRYIVKTRGSAEKENESPFEILFKNSFTLTRGDNLKIQPESVNIFSLPFLIEKNKR